MEDYYLRGVTFAGPGLWTATVSSITNPGSGADFVVATSAAHGLSTNQQVTIAGSTGVTGLNTTWPVQVIDSTHFSLVGTKALTGTPGGAPTVAIPDLDISAMTGDWFLSVEVQGQEGSNNPVLFALEDTADGWATAFSRFMISTRVAAGGQQFNISRRQWGDHTLFGLPNARLRARLISGANARIKIQVTTAP